MKRLLTAFFSSKHSVSVESRANRTSLAISYFFYFGQLGVFVPYVGLFLDSRGFSSTQIGTLLAWVAIARIIGPNLWANAADKTGRIGEVFRFGCLAAFLTFSFIFIVYDYWYLTLVFCLMMMFWTAVLPQLEVITVQATALAKGGYGKLRLWGSIGFICCSLVVGLLIDEFGPETVVVASCFTLLFLYLSSLFVVAPTHKKANGEHAHVDYKQVLGVIFLLFLLASTLLQVSFGTYYNFFALYMRDLGYTGFETGAFIAIGVAAEVLIFMLASKLLSRYSVMNLLALSILLTAVRWLALGFFADSLLIIIISQCIHALSFGLSHAASVHFLHQHFSVQFQSRAQALYVSISFGFGSAIGSYLSGYMWQDGEGASTSFAFSAVCALLAGLIFVVLASKKSLQKAE